MVDTPRTSSDVEQIGQYGFDFVWTKSDKGYCWGWADIADLVPDPYLGWSAEDRARVLRTAAETTGYIETRPLEDNPDLFLKFGDIKPTEEAILAFANEHGWLEDTTHYYYYEDEADPDTVAREEVLPLIKWEKEIKDMADSVRLWQIIKENDNVSLSRLISVEKRVFVYDLRDLTNEKSKWRTPDTRLTPDVQRRMLPGDLTIPAMLVLRKKVNRKLEDNPAGDQLRLNVNNKLEGFRSPASLLSAMWLQFYGWVAGDRNFDTCRVCGKWVDVTNKRPDWKRHSECAANVRARRSNVNGKVKDALRMGQIDETRAKEIESELSEAKTVAALTAVNEKFKAGLEPRKPTAKKPAAKKPTKKATAKKKGAAK